MLAGAGHGLLTDEDPRVPLHLLGLPNVRDAVATEPERSAQLWSRGAAMDVTEAVTTALRGRAAGLASPGDSDPAAHP